LISSALPPSPRPQPAYAANSPSSGDKTHDQHAAFISDSYLSSLHFRTAQSLASHSRCQP